MEDDEIIIGIKSNNTNKNNKTKSSSKKKSKSKNKKKAQNSSKIESKKEIKNKRDSNNKKKNKQDFINISDNSEKHKKSNSKSRVRLSLNIPKDNIEDKKLKIKIITIIMILILCIIIIFSSGLFNIKNIDVSNNIVLTSEKIVSLSSIEKFTNIFKFNKRSAINNIKSNSYIEDVKIKRKLPSTVEITVKERIPTFMMQIADSYVYISNQGYILEISNDRLNIPIIEGYSTDLLNIKVGNRINDDDLKKMNTVIKIYEIAKSNELGGLITKIDISDTKNYTLILESEGKTVYLGDCNDSDLNTKMLYLKSIIDASTGKAGEVFLNVNLNSQNVYVRWSTE